MQNELQNPDVILDKMKKLPRTAIWCMVFGAIMAAGALISVIVALSGEELWWVLAIVFGIFAVMFFLIVWIKKIKSAKKMKNINMQELRNEIVSGCVSFDKAKTYFTQNYMLSNHYYSFVIKYSDIVWIYRHEKRTQNGVAIGADLMICLINGSMEYTIYSDEFCEEIVKHNPNVFESFSFENRKRYKEIVKEYKNNKNAPVPVNSNSMVSPSNLDSGQRNVEFHEVSAPQNETVLPKDMSEIDPLYSIPGTEGMPTGSTKDVDSSFSFIDANDIINDNKVDLMAGVPQNVQTPVNAAFNTNEPLNISQESINENDNSIMNNNVLAQTSQFSANSSLPESQPVEQKVEQPVMEEPQFTPAVPTVANEQPVNNPQPTEPGAIRNPFLNL